MSTENLHRPERDRDERHLDERDLDERLRAARSRLEVHGQEHVLRFVGELSLERRAALLAQIEAIDLEQVDRLFDAVAAPTASGTGEVLPAPMRTVPATRDEQRARDEARLAGEEMIRADGVAVLVVAGGQGTRLGFDRPKGLFPIGPVTDRTLFDLFAEKIEAAERRYDARIPWLVMTSEATHDETVRWFDERGRFGRDETRLRFLTQGTMPAVDDRGKLLLAGRDRIATSPDGHGGSLLALQRSGSLAALERAGVHWIYYFQVDNPLVPVPDPVLLGHHRLERAEMSTKVVSKSAPQEKVGVVCEVDGRACVIEYSDLDETSMHARDARGDLLFRAGNIAVHVFDRAFVERITARGLRLPFHTARKRIPHVDAEGRPVRPDEPNGYKFEAFVFDALPHARRTVTQEVLREEEFSPVKNAKGADSPQTARRDLVAMYARWLEAAGLDVPRDDAGAVAGAVEISPLFALDERELVERIRSLPEPPRFRDGLILTENDRVGPGRR